MLGISIDQPEADLCARVADLASQSADRTGESVRGQPEEILVNAAYLSGGYAVLGDGEVEALRLFAQQEGLLLDPVYTGRAAAGMVDPLQRAEAYQKAEEQIMSSSPIIPIIHMGVDYVYQLKVQGIEPSALGAHAMSYHRVWLKE